MVNQALHLKGISVTLYEKTEVGRDAFNAPIYQETATVIDNVLVEPTGQSDIIDSTKLHGKIASYRLCIPKGDTHKWLDCKVNFFGQDWHVFGLENEYIENLVPLEWNKKVLVERYE